ncbi:GNAT family N-acetyltransferase [Azoarcus taiwanensis]|uniref:GNAT family N-acetyltransferase n=1 Tax=Azoarcus taiwanensis TaxID=666964 RepID=A0A972J9E3_9RHOO|nr:GNAT family N-acetyltransferase [Azoarcus taiwanensis]NMG01913.1 GNAT family N-acetyltransferase [Azoarcus taiwanensis]
MKTDHQIRLTEAISSISPGTWDSVSGQSACLSHAFLSALEDSGSAVSSTGWTPRHLGLWSGNTLQAALPMYEKHHSYGEYVFDWAWADAFARHGLDYYPKLLSAVPFTPVPGARLLGNNPQARIQLLDAVLQIAKDAGHSSLHILFPGEAEAEWMRERGMLVRTGVQFHWLNHDYRDFDDFLSALNHDKRKKIRQERKRVSAHGLTCEWLDGASAQASDWRFFYRCYATTYALHRSTPYLTADFFPMLAERAPDKVRLLLARRGNEPVAASFFLCDDEALYGRYWGASEHLPLLHFELCYYQAIDYCIRNGISRFEGGAQGEHKMARGLEPVVTRSAHWIRDERFRDAVDRFLAREREGVGFYLDELTERSPFRQDTTASSNTNARLRGRS